MIVERRTYKVKHGQWRNLVELIKAEMAAIGPEIGSRIYNPIVGPFGVIVHDLEFKDMAEREKFWAKWMEKRATPEFWAKYHEMVTPHGHSEIWDVVD